MQAVKWMHTVRLGVLAGLVAGSNWVGAQTAGGAQIQGPGQVVVAGTVPDEATRVAVIARLRELYGAERVVDQLALGSVVAPPQWSQHVQKLLSPSLKQVSHGQLSVQGQTVELKGEVGNEALRQQLASEMAQSLNPTYTVRNGLRVAVQEQAVVDQALANRIVEFEPGSAVLRPAGLLILDEMAAALARLPGRRFEVIGHTDAQGSHASNVSLSLARAQAVKGYLVSKGLPADSLSTSGLGPDQPVASNATDEGRARNRRIEFRVGG
ncbi:MAG: OmpA family protein [Aquabacterium sp.]|jgi:OOP family OmpA-OmpF porin|uniref:OmpA family protein n=1 Tax=Aquabacterium sp. TaxID=1872578 RepID=UPI002A3588AB|nr:OmpA family protein [Aquabacterium sp.]MDX9844220.1 OmpA family protein [Aquabacterium sp.]